MKRRCGDKSVGTTKVCVARVREIQKPMAAADFIRDRLLGAKLKAKKIFGVRNRAHDARVNELLRIANYSQFLFNS